VNQGSGKRGEEKGEEDGQEQEIDIESVIMHSNQRGGTRQDEDSIQERESISFFPEMNESLKYRSTP
jgi:hypothetical protein